MQQRGYFLFGRGRSPKEPGHSDFFASASLCISGRGVLMNIDGKNY